MKLNLSQSSDLESISPSQTANSKYHLIPSSMEHHSNLIIQVYKTYPQLTLYMTKYTHPEFKSCKVLVSFFFINPIERPLMKGFNIRMCTESHANSHNT